MQKLVATLLTLVLLTALFAGCQSKPATEEKSSAAQPAAETTTEPAESDTGDSPSWKKDTSPYTLDWFVAYDWYGKKFSPENNLGDQKILEETGVTIDFSIGDTEKFNTLIATDSLPSVVTTDMVAPQRKLLEDNQQLLALDTLMEEHAPDMNVPQSMIDWYRNDDGHWYALASFYYGPERTTPDFGGYYVTHNNNFVRTDILEEIGMTMDDMKTKDGFMQALKKVKEANITYDGKAVTPFLGANEDFFAHQFGVDLEDKDGNLVNMYRTPEFLEALLYFNEMYRNGLITDEEFTMNTQQRETKVASGSAFAMNGWMTVQHPRKSLYSSDPEALIMYCGQIEGGDNGQKPLLASINAGGWTGTMVTKNANNPERIAQFFSFMTTDGMTLDGEFGTDTYEIVDEQVVRIPEKTKEFEDNYQAAFAKYRLDISYFMDWTIIQKYYPEPETLYEKDQYEMETDPNLEVYDNKCFTDIIPESGSEEAIISERVSAHWDQSKPRIIMASSPEECESMLAETIAKMDELGLEQLDEYQNKRFQENKERLGVDRAWPR